MPDPFLRRIPPAELEPDLAAAHRHSLLLRGDATFFEVFGNHPELYRWYTQSFYGDVFTGGRVERRIKELVRLRLSTVHGCRFCNQGNRVDALDAGLSDADIANVGDPSSPHWPAREAAALQLAEQMLLTNPSGRLDAELYADISAHFDDGEILELGLVLGVLTGMAKFLFAFDLVEKEDDCPFPAG